MRSEVLHRRGSSRRLSQNSATRMPSTLCVSIEGFSINHLRGEVLGDRTNLDHGSRARTTTSQSPIGIGLDGSPNRRHNPFNRLDNTSEKGELDHHAESPMADFEESSSRLSGAPRRASTGPGWEREGMAPMRSYLLVLVSVARVSRLPPGREPPTGLRRSSPIALTTSETSPAVPRSATLSRGESQQFRSPYRLLAAQVRLHQRQGRCAGHSPRHPDDHRGHDRYDQVPGPKRLRSDPGHRPSQLCRDRPQLTCFIRGDVTLNPGQIDFGTVRRSDKLPSAVTHIDLSRRPARLGDRRDEDPERQGQGRGRAVEPSRRRARPVDRLGDPSAGHHQRLLQG